MPGRKGVSTHRADAEERREHYFRLRNEGLDSFQAAWAVDPDLSYETRRRYERWYQLRQPPAPPPPVSTAMRGNRMRQSVARSLGIPASWN